MEKDEVKIKLENNFTKLQDEIEVFKNLSEKQKKELQQVIRELNLNEQKLKIINDLEKNNQELIIVNSQLEEQSEINIKFEKEIQELKDERYKLDNKKDLVINKIEKIKNSILKRFLISITCGWYNPNVKLQKKEKNLTFKIINLDNLLEPKINYAKNLAEKYIEFENQREVIIKSIIFNEKELDRLKTNWKEKKNLEQKIKELKNQKKNKLSEKNNINNQVNDKEKQLKETTEEYIKHIAKKEELIQNKISRKESKDSGISDYFGESIDDLKYFKEKEINSIEHYNQPSTSGYKRSSPKI